FMKQTVLYHLKLQLAHSAYYFPAVELTCKHLRNAFVHKLTDTLVELLGLPDTGNFKIGDTLTDGENLNFKGLPSFSPEMFKYIENNDPMKSKQL
ncbi:hypothetical protein P7A61_16135, partial [Clostridium perfringens]|nr:hypothetical protein [Clostridium perfringens]